MGDLAELRLTCLALPITVLALTSTIVGCADREQARLRGDSTAVIIGELRGSFIHGEPPWQDARVYLLPVNARTMQWWHRFSTRIRPAPEPDSNDAISVTHPDGGGSFHFEHLRSGAYYLYSTVPLGWTVDPWLGSTWLSPDDTVNAALLDQWSIRFDFDSTWEANRAALEKELDATLRLRGKMLLRPDESYSGHLRGWIDLNGDGRLDVAMLLRPKTGWSRVGSALLVFRQESDTLVFASRTDGVHAPVYASRTVENGWRELYVFAGNVGYPGQYVRLRDSGGYVADAKSAPLAEDSSFGSQVSVLLIQQWGYPR